jgi:ankyrin repeat protein
MPFMNYEMATAYHSANQFLMVDAAAHGWIDVMRKQLAHGASMHKHDPKGYTPLWLAASYGSVESVEWLLKHGVKPDVPDACPWSRRNDTPLERIHEQLSRRGQTVEKRKAYYDIYKLLVAHGARRGVKKAKNIIRKRNAPRVRALWRRASQFAKVRKISFFWSQLAAKPENMNWEVEMASAFASA